MKELLNTGNETTPIGVMTPGYEHNCRVYSQNGYAPAISAREWKDPIKVLVYEKQCDNPTWQLHEGWQKRKS